MSELLVETDASRETGNAVAVQPREAARAAAQESKKRTEVRFLRAKALHMGETTPDFEAESTQGVCSVCARADSTGTSALAPFFRDVVLRDGTGLRLRTPTSDDYEDIKSFYDELSPESRYSRFNGFVRTDVPARLDAEADGDERVALAAWGSDRVVGLGSYERLREPGVAEVAFTVADDFRGRGVATRILEHLTEIGVERGVDRFVAELEAGNIAMRRVFDRASFSVRELAPGELLASLDIPATETTPERRGARPGWPGCVAVIAGAGA